MLCHALRFTLKALRIAVMITTNDLKSIRAAPGEQKLLLGLLAKVIGWVKNHLTSPHKPSQTYVAFKRTPAIMSCTSRFRSNCSLLPYGTGVFSTLKTYLNTYFPMEQKSTSSNSPFPSGAFLCCGLCCNFS